ncbi:methyltransferase small [Paludibacter propionicigenes WB4]|uniref:Methyltransferase small n=1 Tax=Paludibacter propionicigenes (strain DSM 17365 / JCM 13257 / WB4) TaxID=694427 RepID=E4T628_PALPW|nr:methyltransferase [Paludibacter propionicigenes]ADQ80172.1 methyltransferase small [Paludibacter propionicigenes WB4]
MTNGLGKFKFYHPVGTFSLTPASNILIQAIIDNQSLLHGTGIDWGCGVGCLAILAARIKGVDKVYGLDIAQPNIDAAIINGQENQVADKLVFMPADSYQPFSQQHQSELEKMKGKIDFIIANPPSSTGDDGFAFRRMVLNGAKNYLGDGGIVLLNISFQYGMQRIESLYKNIEGFSYSGVAASTDYVPFDLSRPDLLECLGIYAKEEQKGGYEYTFCNADNNKFSNAEAALKNYIEKGVSPLTKWQTHIFKYNR